MGGDERTRILMMGYVDGELTADERSELLNRCRQDPALARELAQYRRLAAISNAMKLTEPADLEIRRLTNHRGYRAARGAAAVIAVLGFALAVAGVGLDALGEAPPLLLPIGACGMVLGVVLFSGAELWARRRVLSIDGYDEVSR
jgi:anti-sigma factor RsiW